MMETPLQVLSRAASIVDIRESVTAMAPSAGVKRNMESMATDENKPVDEETSYNDIPHKFHKYRRLKEHHERRIAAASTTDRKSPPAANTPPLASKEVNQQEENSESKRCAGTQTSYSSFAEGHPPPAYPYPQGNLSPHPSLLGNHENSLPYSTHVQYNIHRNNSPPASKSSSSSPQSMDIDCNVPLNLTVASHVHGLSHSSVPPYRRSPDSLQRVSSHPIAHLSGASNKSVSTAASHISSSFTSVTSHSSVTHNSESDLGIEEHFKRSLGQKYHTMAHNPTPSNTAKTSVMQHQQSKVVVRTVPAGTAAGCVDDHFAKSLGETWTKIKEEKDPQNRDGTWSVDDHFAKALGDTWFKIKRAKEEEGSG